MKSCVRLIAPDETSGGNFRIRPRTSFRPKMAHTRYLLKEWLVISQVGGPSAKLQSSIMKHTQAWQRHTQKRDSIKVSNCET